MKHTALKLLVYDEHYFIDEISGLNHLLQYIPVVNRAVSSSNYALFRHSEQQLCQK